MKRPIAGFLIRESLLKHPLRLALARFQQGHTATFTAYGKDSNEYGDVQMLKYSAQKGG